MVKAFDQFGCSIIELTTWDLIITTTTTWGYFAIQISSQTTKKDVSEIPLLRTIIPRKFLSFSGGFSFFLNEFLQQNLYHRHTNRKTQLDPRSYCCSTTTTTTMLSNQDNKISHPSSHSRPENSSPEEGK